MGCSMGMALAKQKEAQKRRKMWGGGEVEEGTGDTEANYHPYNSSGEPHTNHKRETEEPMEFMADGGEVQPKRPGVGKGGGLKGAFEHEDDEYKVAAPMPPPPKKEDERGYYAGGSAMDSYDSPRPDYSSDAPVSGASSKKKNVSSDSFKSTGDAGEWKRQAKYNAPSTGFMAGGEAQEREEESFQDEPHMMAGGEAAIPEEKEYQADPDLEDVTADFVGAMIKRKRAKAAAPSR